ncbi:bifunctional hydroxymethylpyrimidine kinase/phosphomethylpyrimidine kinase [Marinoscillum sp. MHG1-6]|uniref:bifunctional hydroxymethylpyrimidine kinase/phosphomethylpyrimidine kinase n=1 Tax=Marinoscillum sp. MHG1-6 TaxID=2959627 RepID=UPI002157074D|nr:bifunctional hydroxymethylpyrimidine kinase/phosphomethylpyrimidine kinase [Marinoscillum sp. MHG1-6]
MTTHFDKRFVLAISGLDPSAGAGLLADIKTMENHGVYGLGTMTANTIQTDAHFYQCDWTNADWLLKQIDEMFYYPVAAAKIGIVQSLDVLDDIISLLKAKSPNIQIVWDPVLSATTGFEFGKDFYDHPKLEQILSNLDVVTPNLEEISAFTSAGTVEEGISYITQFCHCYLKGGHNEANPGVDQVYFSNGEVLQLDPILSTVYPKHGSGCVLSSALASQLALGKGLHLGASEAKKYTEEFLSSSISLLGNHI